VSQSSSIQLTPQQQAIVNHNHGPALVFAVAGAGKTTAMVQRIARLVREGIFPAHQILATSFNKAANEEIIARLKHHPQGERVQVKTLHALGYLIVREAHRRGLLPQARPDAAKESVDGLDRQLLYRALAEARSRRVRYADELNRLDHEDFLNYLGACKGNLHYADLAAAGLPAEAARVAQQAKAPAGLAWYLDLYRIYEEVRRREGLLTFDDMLMTGWEVLVRHESILAGLRRQFQCVLVDEYQDINLAQAEVLDLLTFPHRNYMAIGDDDQTIYEWRGASPRFILGFEERYGAQVYYMTENFRCKAPHVALANRVIEHNQVRRPKRLGLTQGFAGDAHLHLEASAEAMGRHIAEEIDRRLRAGQPLQQMAILVRIYAQTPPIEQFLITRRIPYEIVGSEPFYERAEVRTLLDYCQVAETERLLAGGGVLNEAQAKEFARAWRSIYNQPTRYLNRALADRVAEFVTRGGMSILRALGAAQHEATDRQAVGLGELAEDLHWLLSALGGRRSAETVLRQLEARIQYMAFLKANSGFPETGAAKAANVATFLDYAAGKGTVPQFLHHLAELAAAHKALTADPTQPRVALTTMFRAKGLEWPVVFVPGCNQGTIPYERMASLEEERRLLYVAITRARQTLHLYALRDQPLSQFLTEAAAPQILTSVSAIQRALNTEPKHWRTEEMVGLAIHTQRLNLGDYFRGWWPAPPEQKQRIARLALRILASIDKYELVQKLDVRPGDAQLWRELAGDKPGR
jgi:DNA helicase-2/ATP-dependent DNA helicase PcrA